MSFSGIWASSTRIFLWLWSHFSSWNLLETDSQTQHPGRWEWANAERKHKSPLPGNPFFSRVLSSSRHTWGDCVWTSRGTAEKAAAALKHCSWGQNAHTHSHSHTHSVPRPVKKGVGWGRGLKGHLSHFLFPCSTDEPLETSLGLSKKKTVSEKLATDSQDYWRKAGNVSTWYTLKGFNGDSQVGPFRVQATRLA